MHACGHDGHVAMGLALARVLAARRENLTGRVRFIFQPAEEGVRGARAMVKKGVVDDSDVFLAVHLGMGFPTGSIVGGAGGFLCTTKFDVRYRGRPAHAGAAPQEGRNALLAAANTVLNLHAIAPHSGGPSRINVGRLRAGEGRNVIPGQAFFEAETRGSTEEVAAYMLERARAIVAAGADMYGVDHALTLQGESTTARSDGELADRVLEAARSTGGFSDLRRSAEAGGSDDAAWMMRRVQERGGQAAYVILGTDLAAGHHNGRFDFDESVLIRGVALLERVVAGLLSPA
jgi:aminobenzoyl-glutamate utilization protein A